MIEQRVEETEKNEECTRLGLEKGSQRKDYNVRARGGEREGG